MSAFACSPGTGGAPVNEPRPTSGDARERGTEGAGTLEIRFASSGASLEDQNLVLFIDGRAHGPIPARFHDIPAGRHAIELRDDGGYYRRFESDLEMEPEGSVELRPRLSVARGLVTMQLAEDAVGATIHIRRGSELRRVNVPLPVAVAIELDAHYAIIARSQSGIERVFPIDFSDGIARKTITVTFSDQSPKVVE